MNHEIAAKRFFTDVFFATFENVIVFYFWLKTHQENQIEASIITQLNFTFVLLKLFGSFHPED